MSRADTFLYKKKSDDEIEKYLTNNGWQPQGNNFFEKKFGNFRIVLEKENDSIYGWKFMITGNFKLNNNIVIKKEIENLKEIFSGFWFREDAYKLIGHEVNSEEQVRDAPSVPETFNNDKDEIQYLVGSLLGSGADFIYNDNYFIACYTNKASKLKIKVIKIEAHVTLHVCKRGGIYYDNGEQLL